jgi:hypothetical protein
VRLESERGGLEHGYGRERLTYGVGYKGIRECRTTRAVTPNASKR